MPCSSTHLSGSEPQLGPGVRSAPSALSKQLLGMALQETVVPNIHGLIEATQSRERSQAPGCGGVVVGLPRMKLLSMPYSRNIMGPLGPNGPFLVSGVCVCARASAHARCSPPSSWLINGLGKVFNRTVMVLIRGGGRLETPLLGTQQEPLRPSKPPEPSTGWRRGDFPFFSTIRSTKPGRSGWIRCSSMT